MAVIPVNAYDAKKKKYVSAGQIRSGVFIKKFKKSTFCSEHKAFGIQTDAWDTILIEGTKTLLFQYKRKDWTISVDNAKRVLVRDNLGQGEHVFIPQSETRLL